MSEPHIIREHVDEIRREARRLVHSGKLTIWHVLTNGERCPVWKLPEGWDIERLMPGTYETGETWRADGFDIRNYLKVTNALHRRLLVIIPADIFADRLGWIAHANLPDVTERKERTDGCVTFKLADIIREDALEEQVQP